MTGQQSNHDRSSGLFVDETGPETGEHTPPISRGRGPRRQTSWWSPDLFVLGALVNIVLCLLGSYLLENYGANDWIDSSSITFLWLLGIENIVMLLLARRTNDPFVAILVWLTTMFYMGRVDSLLYDPFSIAFLFAGFPISSDHINTTLRLLLLGNLAVFIGVTAAKVGHTRSAGEVKRGTVGRLVVALAIVLAVNFFLGEKIGVFGRIAKALFYVVLSTHMVLLMAITFLLIYSKQVSWRERVALGAMLTMFVVLTVIVGSRSGVLVLLVLGMCVLLARRNSIKVRWSWLAGAFVVLPLGIALFNVASLVRLAGYKPGVEVSVQRAGEALAFDVQEFGSIKSFVRPVFDRTGYLDYATVMVAGAEYYAAVVNVEYYAKSLVDNLLTPGFEVYNAPKVATTLRFLPTRDIPSQSAVREEYSSSQLSAYGELYVLLPGVWPYVALALMGYAFAALFAQIRAKDEYHLYLYRAVVLLSFHNWLISFGLDWMIIEMTYWIATLLFFERVVVRWDSRRLWKVASTLPISSRGWIR